MPQETFTALLSELSFCRKSLTQHPLYSELNSIPRIRSFMSCHAFAVWDFMVLLKRLQRDLTCVEIPWRPRPDTAMARLINEITVGEESDLGPDGAPISHFELYLQAMRAVGADAAPILRLSFGVAAGVPWRDVLKQVAPLPEVERFVTATMELATQGQTHEVAAAFFFGREAVIPDMFRSLIKEFDNRKGEDLRPLLYYLERHIEVDSNDHGPRAEKLLGRLMGSNEQRVAEARKVALASLEGRRKLWDAILNALPNYDEMLPNPLKTHFLKPDLLLQSFSVFEEKGETLVTLFYERLFERHPSLSQLFRHTRIETQREMLWNALLGVIRYAEDPDSLMPVLRDLGARHIRYGVRPEHYPLVGETLLLVMSELGGEAYTPAMRSAWAEAYSVISSVMLEG